MKPVSKWNGKFPNIIHMKDECLFILGFLIARWCEMGVPRDHCEGELSKNAAWLTIKLPVIKC